LLLYVVYTCQKSFNFINAFASFKQKRKLTPFSLAHPLHRLCHTVMRRRLAFTTYGAIFVLPNRSCRLGSYRY